MSAPTDSAPARGPDRVGKGVPTGGRFATSTRGEADLRLAEQAEQQALGSEEDSAADYLAFMDPGEPPAPETATCASCGSLTMPDPDGSPDVWVHLDEDTNRPDYDLDEDHAPVPESSVPVLGLGAGSEDLTYEGQSADQWRDKAAAARKRSADSWERSDTDGFRSQAANDSMARQYEACAELAEHGGKAEFPALLDSEGNLVRARLIETHYGQSWMLLDDDDQATGEFVGLSHASSAARRNAHYAKKGFRMGSVRVPARVRLSESLMPTPIFVRADGGFSTDAEVVETEQTEDWS